MQTAHEQGTLVLLQNLDPSYTSAEVEVILILEYIFFTSFMLFHSFVLHITTAL
jgi:hypothetical protein